MYHKEVIKFGPADLTIEVGKYAKQADGACMISLGETSVLVTAVSSKHPKEGITFLPLTVDYMERTYSAGRIPGGYFRREGRPTEGEVLNARLIDRPIRPLFPNGYPFETQVVALVMSADKENPPVVPAIIGASVALMISDIPFDGPICGLRVGLINGEMVLNPTFSQMQESDLDMTVAVGRQGIVMVEGGASFVPEDKMVQALMFADRMAQPILDMQERLARELGKEKRVFQAARLPDELRERITGFVKPRFEEALVMPEKLPRRRLIDRIREEAIEQFSEEEGFDMPAFVNLVEDLEAGIVRTRILEEGRRIDGRKPDEIRPITCEVGVLSRTHGSALFQRGETQAVVTVTLGTMEDSQHMELLTGEIFKRFILHYNFPPFCVGEVKRMFGPSRREIGHAHLAHWGVKKILPLDDEDFPYTIRVVSEVLESNGSSSMATVCGSSLALMDAGVPVSGPVAGVAMGLVKEGDKVVVLSDILGDEDHVGDMDFKIVGNDKGITAVQMDIKCSGLTEEILTKALNQARDGRLHILGKMNAVIDRPRPEYSRYAPSIQTIQINPERIKDLIGPGGKHIKGIMAATGVSIDVENDGRVKVASTDPDKAKEAIEMIHEYTAEAEVGKIYEGEVVKIMDFGAFVNILKGVDGLVHISELTDHRVARVEDVVQEGDHILVKVKAIDPQGKISLSRQMALKETGKTDGASGSTSAPGHESRKHNGSRDRGGRRDRGPRRR